ncbi:hypothetical protein, conserved [Eimeria tenella]|uniref:Uncharacterized protein n=1 Tax=Eimeria tenella TaxID=5802 RepID=U6L636_EIMTE|nr:hypothetical protein, conserved [Eimeria tenella]CDJ44663.1 hypothetical protein, conserved [Eimeria tenella]|eukprot:XP_013235411.1 hypothetical protein, conserved [Eimeria tenella]
MFPLYTLAQLSALCRKLGVGLIVSQCCGPIGFFIQDFGTIKKEGGEKTIFSHPPLPEVFTARLGDLDPKVHAAVFAVLGMLRWECEARERRRPLGSPEADPGSAEAAAAAAAEAAAAAAAAAAAEVKAAAAKVFAADGLQATPEIWRATKYVGCIDTSAF